MFNVTVFDIIYNSLLRSSITVQSDSVSICHLKQLLLCINVFISTCTCLPLDHTCKLPYMAHYFHKMNIHQYKNLEGQTMTNLFNKLQAYLEYFAMIKEKLLICGDFNFVFGIK